MDKVRQLIRLSIVNETGASAITNVVADRVYPSQVAAQPNPVYPCLCFQIQAGVGEAVTNVWQGTMRTWCWSDQNEVGTYDDAVALHQALETYWHRQSFNDATLLRAVALSILGVPTQFFDPDVRAYAAVADWNLFASELTS